MGQIQGALVGIALVLSAVFIPMAFWWLYRRNLSSILGYNCRINGAFCSGRINPNSRPLCHNIKTYP